ncbi:OmpH family outer membrane protein [Wenzhouxiangella sp. XN201]|uniref:OmpH family outer membrane protein n=1 Tax=Wenzhouxiangella sp. XN201 TaxID=2710755 RepID=UPI0013C5881D|nr:OmpH family outer membrane protein [Wenzhouxiangella sp. XN201]NEZ04544.1 OmpH family outer membrane protein [Wenzhouxiangella sp. XN201]
MTAIHTGTIDRKRPTPLAALCFLALLFMSFAASAQDDVRIGYVDMKRLFETAPQVVNAREALDREFRPRNEALIADEARLEDMQEELAAATGADAEQQFEMEREVRNLQRSIERRREDLREELRFRLNARKNSLEETIDIAVREVARDGNFDLILTSPVAYAADRIDITDRILDWLEADFENETENETDTQEPPSQ